MEMLPWMIPRPLQSLKLHVGMKAARRTPVRFVEPLPMAGDGGDFLCIASIRENHFFLNRVFRGIFKPDQELERVENMRKCTDMAARPAPGRDGVPGVTRTRGLRFRKP